MNTSQDGQLPVIVLLVEDETLVRMIAAEVLREESGFKVIEAANADEALTVLEATADVRVLVTDVEMPGSLNGFTLARVGKQAWPHIGIVVTSGRLVPGSGGLPAGAFFMPKPYTPDALMTAVRSVLAAEQAALPAEAPIPTLPTAIKINSPHSGIGTAGGLAQPLPEPEE